MILFIGGESLNRDSLIAFSESLKSVNKFINVDLPLANLAKNRDVDFDIKVELNQANQ